MERAYIKTTKPTSLPDSTHLLKTLDDDFWKAWIFHYLLTFYQNYDTQKLTTLIHAERKKKSPRIERVIARFIRMWLNADIEFGFHFQAFGENTNDEDVEGNYDITITNSYWKSKNFHFECKRLDNTPDLVHKYIYCNTYTKDSDNEYKYDGGVFRYFNGKYAQQVNFGGMIGFVLAGDVSNTKMAITQKLQDKFKTSPEGDLIQVIDNSIEHNDFTFDSHHNRKETVFVIHHLLFDFV